MSIKARLSRLDELLSGLGVSFWTISSSTEPALIDVGPFSVPCLFESRVDAEMAISTVGCRAAEPVPVTLAAISNVLDPKTHRLVGTLDRNRGGLRATDFVYYVTMRELSVAAHERRQRDYSQS